MIRVIRVILYDLDNRYNYLFKCILAGLGAKIGYVISVYLLFLEDAVTLFSFS
jgi:hypothetical protein